MPRFVMAIGLALMLGAIAFLYGRTELLRAEPGLSVQYQVGIGIFAIGVALTLGAAQAIRRRHRKG